MTAGPYQTAQPTRAETDALPGATVLDFGANWCGYCQGARPVVEAALADRPGLRHLRVEDGRGRPLGRSYGVKLWPTLVVLRDGVEVARVVRPTSRAQVDRALDALGGPVAG